MRIEIDARAVVRHRKALQNLKPRVEEQLWMALRATDVDMERHIKSAMPVDTGRARASWGRWTPGDLQRSNRDAKESDAVHRESRGDLEIVQGTNVDYVGRLNAGHSRQAAAGFLDVAAAIAKAQLARLAREIGLRVRL